MSSRTFPESDAHREAARPTLPSVRELFPELSRTPRPSVIPPPSWVGSNHDPYCAPHMGQSDVLSGPGLQRNPSTPYHPISSRSSRHETHPTHLHPSHEHPPHSMYHSQHPPNQFSRSSTNSGQGRPTYDYTSHPGPSSYLDYSRHQYAGQSMMEPPGSASYIPRYPDVRGQHYRRDSQETTSSIDDSSPHANAGPSSLKYECDYCGKGFNRPSSLKIHLNSHTGEKPFTCTFEGCGRSFSVLSNMRRHARVHADASGRYHEDSDESNDAHSRSGR
ncbi:hypothetical protein C8R48DRAFT_766513 [Suillus tomentosus]|nr:hypothetical protein C8R48DRAFT_766513 [Suillus tomentosus]